MTQRDFEGLKYLFLRDRVGLGTLDPLIVDPYMEEICCTGMGTSSSHIKFLRGLKGSIVFQTLDELDDFLLWGAEKVKKPVFF